MDRSDTEGNADEQLIGSYLGKCRSDRGSRIVLGKVVSFDSGTKVYEIFYENGSRECLDCEQVRKILMVDSTRMSQRKRKLDQLATYGEVGRPNTRSRKNNAVDSTHTDDSPTDTDAQLSLPCEETADSSSDSCDYDRNPDSRASPQMQVVPLPPSSGDISVPEESVPHLFCIYNFLRSFSHQLFLSPFRLEDFVGSLNCTVQNTVLDAVHLSLMRSLRRHLQTLSSEDSELASKCLRLNDWNLLDALTWPAILVGYLYVMGYMKQLDEKGFRFGVSSGEYYELPVALKLKVLQLLCDDVVDSGEIRAELEMREETEEADESNVSYIDNPENGPRRVHPRYSKTSACQNREALESSIEPKLPISKSKVSEPDIATSEAGEDGNSDECRLCSMDGMLICCDGCPSAYHSRCIGLNKATLPNGSWFCPECTINKLGMVSSKIGRRTNGAEIFGTDANGRMFLGTCNYLLVIGTSSNSESLVRYYNHENVTDVLTALLAAENAPAYADICRGISNYWEVPILNMQSVKPGPNLDPPADNEHGLYYDPSCIVSPKRTTSVFNDANGLNSSTNAEALLDNKVAMYQKNHCTEEVVNGSSILDTTVCSDACNVKDEPFDPETATLTAEKTPLMSGPTNISDQLGYGSVVTDVSYSSQPLTSDRLNLLETATCGSANENVVHREDTPSVNFSLKKQLFRMSNDSKFESHTNDGKSLRMSKFPALFKPQSYTNQYIQGDVAASAAANLVVLAAEEDNVSEARTSSNPKKTVAANIALQMKAFSGSTINFFWPGFDKKLAEIPRERCGWCIACKAASTCKKGCLLNLAATNAMKRSVRNFCGLRSVKHFETHFPIIAAQIAHMEESLTGLILGPLSDVEYNKQWHQLIREVSSCKLLKFLLLELEKNIRGIAFSGDWTKVVDDCLVEFSSAVSGVCRTGTSKRRGRRPKKQSASSEFEQHSGDDCKNMLWWRGGLFSRILFQRRALPSSVIKKASRQGGNKRISGVNYPEGSELPRRSRQYAWRASVELSKNASQLALQVRYLDAHVRWKDLVRPEQSPQDSKGSDVDAMAFRNAIICDKKIVDNKIKYGLTFASQNHLPLRVTKNIVEAEKLQDGNEKLWFLESHVPLYLIKEYEEKSGLKPMLRPHSFPVLRRSQLKNKADIYSYLMHRVDGPRMVSCASCQQDVVLREAARCSTCQGYFHRDCSLPSLVVKEDNLQLSFTCKSCNAKSIASISNCKMTSNTQVSLKGQILQHSPQVQYQQVSGIKCVLPRENQKSAQPVGKMEISRTKNSVSGSNSQHKVKRRQASTYGLIWKQKKGNNDSDKSFRINNIVLKGKDFIHSQPEVICLLCNKPYRSDLMYICCENCQRWYHADALQLEEAQIFDLIGFKCSRCRRKPSPKCPYENSDYKTPDKGTVKLPVTAQKGTQSDALKLWHSNTENFVTVHDDPLLRSYGKVEPIGEQSAVQLDGPTSVTKGKQKLSVRKPQVKLEKGGYEFNATDNAFAKCIEFSESLPNLLVSRESNANETLLAVEEPNLMLSNSSALLNNWNSYNDCSYGDGGNDNMNDPPETVIAEEMEYEPQTYFSFTELLASEDNQLDYKYDIPIDNFGNWNFTAYDEPTNHDVPSFETSVASAHEPGYDNIQITTVKAEEAVFDEVEPGYNNIQITTVKDEEAVFNEVPCHICKLSNPSPELTCETCKMHIHSHCSPWEDSEGDQWNCGNCREWR